MRIAVISDTHGNCIALDAVLADIEGQQVDRMVCLGDMIQGGAMPVETVERVRSLNCPVVMGNADAWMLTGKETGSESTSESQLRVRDWQLAKLSEEQKAYIAGFAPTVEIELEGGHKLLCFHGTPGSFDEVMLPETPEEEFQGYIGQYGDYLLTGGHTHMQQIRRTGKYFFFNPGSVGLAYNRNQPEETFTADPWADYAILTSEGDRLGLEFRRAPYDVEKWISAIFASGRPDAETSARLFGWSGGADHE